MDLGTTYAYSKSKTIDALKITGSFVYEKGSDLMVIYNNIEFGYC